MVPRSGTTTMAQTHSTTTTKQLKHKQSSKVWQMVYGAGVLERKQA